MSRPISEHTVEASAEKIQGMNTAESQSQGKKPSNTQHVPPIQLISPTGKHKDSTVDVSANVPYNLQIMTNPPELLRQGEYFIVRVKFYDEEAYEYDLKSARFLQYDECGNGVHFLVDVAEVGVLRISVKLFRCVTLGDGTMGPSDPIAIKTPDLAKEEQYLWTFRDEIPGTFVPAADINTESNEAEFLIKCCLHSRAREFFQLQVSTDETHVAYTSKFACYDVVPAKVRGISIYSHGEPYVHAVDPPSGVCTGGSLVYVYIQNYRPDVRPLFGGLEAVVLGYNSSSSYLVCQAPPHTPGTVDLLLERKNGEFKKGPVPITFHYSPDPTILIDFLDKILPLSAQKYPLHHLQTTRGVKLTPPTSGSYILPASLSSLTPDSSSSVSRTSPREETGSGSRSSGPTQSQTSAANVQSSHQISTLMELLFLLDKYKYSSFAFEPVMLELAASIYDCRLQTAISMNSRDDVLNSFLMIAIFMGYKHLARLLIDTYHVELNAKNINGDTPMHFAARSADRNFLSYVLTKRPDINTSNIWGETPVSLAAECGIDLEAMTPLEPTHLLPAFQRTNLKLQARSCVNMRRCRGSGCVRRCPKEYIVTAHRKSRVKAPELLNLTGKMDQKAGDANARNRSNSHSNGPRPKTESVNSNTAEAARKRKGSIFSGTISAREKTEKDFAKILSPRKTMAKSKKKREKTERETTSSNTSTTSSNTNDLVGSSPAPLTQEHQRGARPRLQSEVVRVKRDKDQEDDGGKDPRPRGGTLTGMKRRYQNKKEAKSIFKEEATQRSRRPSPVQPTLTKLAVEEKKEARSQEDPSGLKHLSNLSNYVSSASEDSVFSDVTEIPPALKDTDNFGWLGGSQFFCKNYNSEPCFLRKKLLDSDPEIEKVIRELQTLKKLKTTFSIFPNLVIFRQVDEESCSPRKKDELFGLQHPASCFLSAEKMLWIISPLMECPTLEVFLSSYHLALTEEQTVTLLYNVLFGLSLLHTIKIIHREISPQTILINSEGKAKLTGYRTPGSSENSKYTPITCYDAPELWDGKKSDFASDIWSVGVLFYRCATGKLPFGDTSPKEAIVLLGKKGLPPNSFSSTFTTFLTSCLSSDPEQRRNCNQLLRHPVMAQMHTKEANFELKKIFHNFCGTRGTS